MTTVAILPVSDANGERQYPCDRLWYAVRSLILEFKHQLGWSTSMSGARTLRAGSPVVRERMPTAGYANASENEQSARVG